MKILFAVIFLLFAFYGKGLRLKDSSYKTRKSSEQQEGLECNFDGKELCNRVSQSKDDDFDWLLRKGTTPSSGTGPSADVSGNGYYAYIEASSPRRRGDNARLVFKPGLICGATCISFRYHMLGESVGKLKVWVDGIVRFEKSGNQGREWMKADLKLEKPMDANTLFIFEGIVGKNWQGDIAIDDVKIRSCGSGGASESRRRGLAAYNLASV